MCAKAYVALGMPGSVHGLELHSLAHLDHIASAQAAIDAWNFVLGVPVRKQFRPGGRDDGFVAANVIPVLMGVQNLCNSPPGVLCVLKTLSVVQRIDGKGLARFRTSDQVIEISVGVVGPNLLDDHVDFLTIRNRGALGCASAAQPSASSRNRALATLPSLQNATAIVLGRVHVVIVVCTFGRQFNDITIGVPKIDGINEAVVGDSPRFDAPRTPFGQHGLEVLAIDFQRNVKVEVMLALKLKRIVRRLEERQVGSIVEPVEGMQDVRVASGLGFLDPQGTRERQPRKSSKNSRVCSESLHR